MRAGLQVRGLGMADREQAAQVLARGFEACLELLACERGQAANIAGGLEGDGGEFLGGREGRQRGHQIAAAEGIDHAPRQVGRHQARQIGPHAIHPARVVLADLVGQGHAVLLEQGPRPGLGQLGIAGASDQLEQHPRLGGEVGSRRAHAGGCLGLRRLGARIPHDAEQRHGQHAEQARDVRLLHAVQSTAPSFRGGSAMA